MVVWPGGTRETGQEVRGRETGEVSVVRIGEVRRVLLGGELSDEVRARTRSTTKRGDAQQPGGAGAVARAE